MNQKTYWIYIVTLAIGIGANASANTLGQQIASQGNNKGAMACSGCHGLQGEGNPAMTAPMLAGLNATYLAKQLEDFRKGTRTNGIMEGVANALSATESKAVADYFAGLKPTPAGSNADSAQVAMGEEIATRGLWSKDVPACTQCHGKNGEGVGLHFPALAGQHAGYIENQFQAWKSGTRSNDPNALMKSVAERLTDEEVQAVAAYLARLTAPGK